LRVQRGRRGERDEQAHCGPAIAASVHVLIERAPAGTRHPHRHHIPKWLRIAGFCFLGLIVAAIVMLAIHWPFSRDAVQKALESATSRPVEIGAFHSSYFPPGCTAENIRVLHEDGKSGEPLITIEKLLVQSSLTGMLFFAPKRLAQVKVVGMHVRIPGKRKDGRFTLGGQGGKSLSIGKIVADGAVLEFMPSEPGKKPFLLRIEDLEIRDVGAGMPMKYRANVRNSEPPGLIRSEGHFGPWNADDPGATPVKGTFLYNDVKLGELKGISGTMQAKGKFEGPLGKMRTDGDLEAPDFLVDGSGNAVRLTVGFKAMVNGTNGDVRLEPVDAHFWRTTLVANGSVAGRPGEKGKTTTLDLAIRHGRIQDLLRLFSKDKVAPMSGAVALRAKFLWPPGEGKFLQKIRMDLDFGIDDAKFQSDATQEAIDRIAKAGEGENKKEQEADARTMLGDLRGHVAFRNGIATLTKGSFTVPGASATIHGTYNLLDHTVNLHGVLDTKGKLSDSTTGFKSLIAKLITPFFKKKNEVKLVPFKITGTFANASVSLD
jgi:hypothetical protein